jgi:hypothetical protein
VKSKLEDKSARFAVWARANGLAIHGAKTQLLVSSNAGPAAGLTVHVDGNDIICGHTLDLLGFCYDRKLTAAPHAENMAKTTKQRAALIARLAQHLPRGQYLQQLASGLVLGKVSHALAAVAAPRLRADTPTVAALKAVQVSVNNVARSITGVMRSDRVRVAELNAMANLPTINALVTRTVAMEAWAAFNSCDGNRGEGTPWGLPCLTPVGTTSLPARPRPARSKTHSEAGTCLCLTA